MTFGAAINAVLEEGDRDDLRHLVRKLLEERELRDRPRERLRDRLRELLLERLERLLRLPLRLRLRFPLALL